jgi:1-aminocyclopropane-1-carboxylate deaminase
MREKLSKLSAFWPLTYHSRVQRLPSFDTALAKVFVKRDDELGPLSLGTKLRKYLSLLPYLKGQCFTVAALGSENSNNMLAFAMLAREAKIPAYFFLRKGYNEKRMGNALFLTMLLDKERTFFVAKNFSPGDISTKYRDLQFPNLFLLPEGGSHIASLAGALTLAEDIIDNQNQIQKSFSAIFIDSGTAFSAAALTIGLGYHQINTKVYIVQMAGDDAFVPDVIQQVQAMFLKQYGFEVLPSPYQVLWPSKGRSFGAVCKEHIAFIDSIAKEEGLLLDTVYNAKLFYTAKNYIQEHSLNGNILIIHSGGTLSLTGFSDLL